MKQLTQRAQSTSSTEVGPTKDSSQTGGGDRLAAAIFWKTEGLGMKLVRFGNAGTEKPGILDANGRIRDLSGIVDDIDGATLSDAALARITATDLGNLPMAAAEVRLGACINGVGKFICIGLNYSDHAEESGMEVPPEPVIFFKATSSIIGPNDDVLIPRGSKKTDWEVELGVVIGKTTSYVSEADAMDYVAGYCVINDLSEREFQLEHSGQWVKGKSCDTFGPLGPWLVTKDEIYAPQSLRMTLDINGHRYQNGSTSTMIYKIPFLVSYLSQFMSLHPGDIISTGTPPGVGLGQNPEVYLKAGDRMTLSIEGLGTQTQNVKQA